MKKIALQISDLKLVSLACFSLLSPVYLRSTAPELGCVFH